ncbi:MAG: AIR synthase-related protein, partial [Gemmatimonadota bacterium]
PDVYHQLAESTAGMAEACRRLETPVVSGNVSLYNENPKGAIFPTPVVGMVGVLDDVTKTIGAGFREPGHAVVLLGHNSGELGASEYLKVVHGRTGGPVPDVDLDAEKALADAVLAMIEAGLLASAHDCAEGGLAVCLAESAIGAGGGPLGLEAELADDLPPTPLLFGEAQGRIVVSCPEDRLGVVLATAGKHDVPAARIGTVGPRDGELVIAVPGTVIRAETTALAEVYRGAIPGAMETPTASR